MINFLKSLYRDVGSHGNSHTFLYLFLLFSLCFNGAYQGALQAESTPQPASSQKKVHHPKKKIPPKKRKPSSKKSRKKLSVSLSKPLSKTEKKQIPPLPTPKASASVILPITEKTAILDKDLAGELKKIDEAILSFSNPKNIQKPDAEAHSFLEATEKGLTFTGKKLPGMAIVKILDRYWIFFDKKYPFALPQKYPFGVEEVLDKSTEAHTIMSLQLTKNFWPNLSSEKNKWVVEFSPIPRLSRTKKIIRMPSTIDKPIKILMPSYVCEIAWQHPETKISYSIFTSRKQDSAFTPQQNFPQLTLIESYVGLGLHPKTDSLVVQRDVEDINIFDAKGMTSPEEVLGDGINTVFLSDTRAPYKIQAELQQLKSEKQTAKTLLKQIQLGLKLGFFSEVGIMIKKLESLCPHPYRSDKSTIDFLKLVLLTLSPHDENAKETIDFVNHSHQNHEFAFWYNLYKRIPQNYEKLVVSVVSTYPVFLKNKVVEILLTFPDEYENLKNILKLTHLHKDIRERARLKLALMQPIDIRELQELSAFSRQREVQAKAVLEILLEKKKEKNFDSDAAVKDLESFLLSFGDRSFEAKAFLSELYIQKRNYKQAIHLLKDLAIEEKSRNFETKEYMKKTYLSFFQDVFDKKENKPGLEKFSPHGLDIVAFFNDFKHLTPEGESGTKIIGAVVDALKGLSLYKPAIEILNKQIEQVEEGPQKNELFFSIAGLHLSNKDTESAEKALLSLTPGNLTESQKQRDLLIDVYLLKNNPTKALTLVGEHKDLTSLLQKERIYWFMEGFENLTTFIPSFIDEVQEQHKKAELATHLAIANVLVKNPPLPFIDLRKRYEDLVKGTPFEKDFFMATTPEVLSHEGLYHFRALDGLLSP